MTTIETQLHLAVLLTLAATAGVQGAAHAAPSSGGDVEAVAGAPSLPVTAPPESAPPYSLPWQLRPVMTGNMARIDSLAAAFNDANGNLDAAVATVVAVSYQINRDWTPMIRLEIVGNDAPGAAVDGSSFANPMV